MARRMGTLRGEVARERYLHLLPAYVRRFVELAGGVLGLKVRGDMDGHFSLVATRPGAMDPFLAALEGYPPSARERLRVRRPEDDRPCIWLHPGEPVFDAMCERVLAACEEDAERGAIFVDPRAGEPYLLHLGTVAVEEEGGVASPDRRTLERRLVGLHQGDDGRAEEVSLEQFALLQGAPHVPPGAVPLAARAVTLRAEAAAHLEREAHRMTGARRKVVRAGLPERRERVGLNFNLKGSDAAKRRTELSRDHGAKAEELEAVKREQRELGSQRRLAMGLLDAEPEKIVPGEARFLAHAVVVPPTGQGEVEAFDVNVEALAMRIASEWERGRGAKVTDVSRPAGARMAGLTTDYPGFDLLAVGGRRGAAAHRGEGPGGGGRGLDGRQRVEGGVPSGRGVLVVRGARVRDGRPGVGAGAGSLRQVRWEGDDPNPNLDGGGEGGCGAAGVRVFSGRRSGATILGSTSGWADWGTSLRAPLNPTRR